MKKLAALPRITVAMSLAALPAAVFAQAAPAAQTELSEIEVLAKRVNARNRVDTPAPTLSYDEEYFQRFEPMSVGDMMKRVPGVSFPTTSASTPSRPCAASAASTRRCWSTAGA